MRIQLYVPQNAAVGVKPGIDAVVRVPEIPGRTFPGKVTRTADALDPATRTLLTEIDLLNPDGILHPGIYCTVELQVPRIAPSLIVPASAIVFNDQGLHVLVVRRGVAHLRKITETRDLGTEVEVDDGVEAGDEVVLNPSVDLGDRSRVAIRASNGANAPS
jgi:RND family efflux transporter MFP subunit